MTSLCAADLGEELRQRLDEVLGELDLVLDDLAILALRRLARRLSPDRNSPVAACLQQQTMISIRLVS